MLRLGWLLLPLGPIACGGGAGNTFTPTSAPISGSAAPSGATASDTGPSADGEWAIAARDYASTRFSALSEINTSNVANLRTIFTFSTGVVGGHEAAPIVVGGTMYIVTPFPNTLYALDLTKPGAPMKWRYDPDPAGAARGVAWRVVTW